MAVRKKTVIAHDPLLEMQNAAETTSAREDAASDLDESPGADLQRIVLGENLTIQEVAELIVPLRSAFDAGTPIGLDATALGTVDGAGVQLLCAFFKEAQNQQVKVTWLQTSAALDLAAGQLGVAGAIGLGT